MYETNSSNYEYCAPMAHDPRTAQAKTTAVGKLFLVKQ